MQRRLDYRDFTNKDMNAMALGCGGKGGWFDPPEFCFHASCKKHDISYAAGRREADRLRADKGFHKAMKKDASDQHWSMRWAAYSLAWIYYKSVRKFGKKYFNYSDKYATKQEILDQLRKKKK